MPDTEADKFRGILLDDSHYDYLITEPCRIYKPNGELLIQIVRKQIKRKIPTNILSRCITGTPTNRGTATLKGSMVNNIVPTENDSIRYKSKTNRVNRDSFGDAKCDIFGYFDRYTRFPYARETAFLINHRQEWRQLQEFIHEVNAIFAHNMPEKYNIQKAMASKVHPAWIIGNTAFSTITANKNYRTACHKDAGDLKEGFGCMAYFEQGKLSGGYLVMPKYRIGVKLSHGDVVLFDVHSWHGNTELIREDALSARLTTVFYLRDNLLKCGSPDYELERAKHCRQLGTMYDKAEVERAEQIKSEVLAQYGISYSHSK